MLERKSPKFPGEFKAWTEGSKNKEIRLIKTLFLFIIEIK